MTGALHLYVNCLSKLLVQLRHSYTVRGEILGDSFIKVLWMLSSHDVVQETTGSPSRVRGLTASECL